MPYNFAADSFHTKKLCSRSEVRFSTQIGRFAFSDPLMGDLRATYYDHLRLLRLIGKRVVDFLLALIELFSLGVSDYRFEIGDYAPTGAG